MKIATTSSADFLAAHERYFSPRTKVLPFQHHTTRTKALRIRDFFESPSLRRGLGCQDMRLIFLAILQAQHPLVCYPASLVSTEVEHKTETHSYQHFAPSGRADASTQL